jgi:8-oxo-dGTP diphosphatase
MAGEKDGRNGIPGKKAGSGILFVNARSEVLLLLRDNKPEIPFPNCWDIPGGILEPDETPEECVIREMKEEIGEEIRAPKLFHVYEYPDRTDYVFWLRRDLEIERLELTEGERLKWFSETDVSATPDNLFAFGFKAVILDFYRERPFAR